MDDGKAYRKDEGEKPEEANHVLDAATKEIINVASKGAENGGLAGAKIGMQTMLNASQIEDDANFDDETPSKPENKMKQTIGAIATKESSNKILPKNENTLNQHLLDDTHIYNTKRNLTQSVLQAKNRKVGAPAKAMDDDLSATDDVLSKRQHPHRNTGDAQNASKPFIGTKVGVPTARNAQNIGNIPTNGSKT